MTTLRHTALIALIAFLAAIAGVFVGRTLVRPTPEPGAELHALLHEQLDLDATQRAKLEAIEAHFAERRTVLEHALRDDNARLAAAIEAEHGNGPRVAAAIDRAHADMGTLQKETLAHIFAMRALLRPDQAARFDRAVVKALTTGGR